MDPYREFNRTQNKFLQQWKNVSRLLNLDYLSPSPYPYDYQFNFCNFEATTTVYPIVGFATNPPNYGFYFVNTFSLFNIAADNSPFLSRWKCTMFLWRSSIYFSDRYTFCHNNPWVICYSKTSNKFFSAFNNYYARNVINQTMPNYSITSNERLSSNHS